MGDTYQNIIDKLNGEVVQVGTDCTVNIYNITNITNNYYNHPPPTDQQGQGQPTVTVQEEVKVEVIKSDRRPHKPAEPPSAVTWVDGRGQTVVLEPGDVLTDLFSTPEAIYIGDGMIVTVHGGTIKMEIPDDMNGLHKSTPMFKPGVPVLSQGEAARRAIGKVGEAFIDFHEFTCWCYTGLTTDEACDCSMCRGIQSVYNIEHHKN